MKLNESDIISNLQSNPLRAIAQYLIKNGNKITFYGKTWTKASADWVYFDAILDLDALKSKFQLNSAITIHENTDPKSGTERGFIDESTGEGLMGKLA